MTRYIITSLLLLTSYCLPAKITKADADTLYSQHHYEQALESYTVLLKEHSQSPELLYNIGNCYYRNKDIAKAILSYERAARINPSDDNIRHNLTLARSQTQDKLYSSSDLDVVYSFNSFVNMFGTDGWAWLSVLALAILLCCILVVRYNRRKNIRKLSFTAMALSAVCIILFNVFALIQNNRKSDYSSAIVMKTTRLMSTPDTTGTVISTLHGGTKVFLNDTTLHAWTEVTVSDDHKGWVQNTDIERI